MKDNQEIGVGLIDMSSDEPHVTIDCPLCGKSYMKKVEVGQTLYTPCDCLVQYKLAYTDGQGVNVEMSLTKEQYEKFLKL